MTEAEKRPREEHPEQGHADKKRRRQGFTIGDRGIFYTTVGPRRERDASQSIMRALDTTEQKGKENSLQASLAAEADQLRERPLLDVGAQLTPKGTGFLKFNNENVPSKVVEGLLAQVEKREKYLRFVCRILPMDITCKPHLDDFVKVAEEKVKPIFDELRASNGTWALEFKSRNCSTIKKEQVLKTLDQWSTNVKACLGDPTVCILVEVNPLFCGVSLVSNWGRFKKYNASIVAGEKPGANAQKPAAKDQKGDVAGTEAPKEGEKAPVAEAKKDEDAAAVVEEPKKEETAAVEEPKKEEIAAVEEPKKEETAAVEEPKKEEIAAVEEPKKEETAAVEEPKKAETAAVEEPKKEETAAVEEPKKAETAALEEPKKEESTAVEEPKKEETSAIEEPKKEETAAVEEPKKDETAAVEEPKKEEEKPATVEVPETAVEAKKDENVTEEPKKCDAQVAEVEAEKVDVEMAVEPTKESVPVAEVEAEKVDVEMSVEPTKESVPVAEVEAEKVDVVME